MKIRNQEIHVLFTPEELAALHRKMEDIGVKNRSAFIRKMSLDGYVVHLDTSDIREMIHLLRQSSNNLNQVAKRQMPPAPSMAQTLPICRRNRMKSGKPSRR